jgi:diguanylate cyclase (GGDEF)-like protein
VNRSWGKSAYIIIGIVVVSFTSFIGFTSLTPIRRLRADARAIRCVNNVQGDARRLVVEELMGRPDDSLLSRIDSNIAELLTAEGGNALGVLRDDEFRGALVQVPEHWEGLKERIFLVREGGRPQELLEEGERYFRLLDRTLSLAETSFEKRIEHAVGASIAVNAIFILFALVSSGYFIRSAASKSKTEALRKIIYVDPLTRMNNRASCEQRINALATSPPRGSVAAVMFDMNNIKIVNDFLGYKSGDLLISDFADILMSAAADYGFVGRYGGDEFLALLQDTDELRVQAFLADIDRRVAAYNAMHLNEIEKIRFAVGYAISSLKDTHIAEVVHGADRQMFAHKRRLKG